MIFMASRRISLLQEFMDRIEPKHFFDTLEELMGGLCLDPETGKLMLFFCLYMVVFFLICYNVTWTNKDFTATALFQANSYMVVLAGAVECHGTPSFVFQEEWLWPGTF